jgi:transposase InsO family protein
MVELVRAGREPEELARQFERSAIAFGERCREMGVRPSMGSVGDAYDNAMCTTRIVVTPPSITSPPSTMRGASNHRSQPLN